MASGEGQLARIVLDEAHVVVTEASFRKDVRAIAFLRRLPVPFFFLTATLPPEDEHILRSTLDIRELMVIRGPVSRPNIQYQVSYPSALKTLD